MPAQPLRQDDVSGSVAASPTHQVPEHIARRSGPRVNRRSLVAPNLSQYATPFERAAQAALPWTLRTFPGLYKGLVAIFAGRVDYQTIAHWRSGRRVPPSWACQVIADYLRGRARAMLDAADTLEGVGQPARRGVAATAARKAKRRARAAREV